MTIIPRLRDSWKHLERIGQELIDASLVRIACAGNRRHLRDFQGDGPALVPHRAPVTGMRFPRVLQRTRIVCACERNGAVGQLQGQLKGHGRISEEAVLDRREGNPAFHPPEPVAPASLLPRMTGEVQGGKAITPTSLIA